LYLANGERVISDHGARRDIIDSYAHGVSEHLQRLARITPLRDFTLQLDEPLFDAVLDVTVSTASGYRTLRSIPRAEVRSSYAQFLEVLSGQDPERQFTSLLNLPTGDERWIERVEILHQAGADALVIDPEGMTNAKWERIAGLVEGGGRVFLQALAPGARAPGVVQAVKTILRPWRQLGLGLEQLGALTLMPRGDFSTCTSTQAIGNLQHLASYAQALEQTRVDA